MDNRFVRAPFIALGYHRSGTSLLAGLMQCCGIHMGDKLYGALPSNPKGHFEEINILRFQKDFMRKMCGSDGGIEHQPSPEVIAKSWDFAEAEETVKNGFSHLRKTPPENKPWGWKDPRTMMFIRRWTELYPSSRILLVIRHPACIAESLRRRDGWGFGTVMDSWFRFHLAVMELASLRQCGVFEYDTLVGDPLLLYKYFKVRVGSEDMLGLNPDQSAAEACVDFVEPDFHNVKSIGSITPSGVSSLWSILKAKTTAYVNL